MRAIIIPPVPGLRRVPSGWEVQHDHGEGQLGTVNMWDLTDEQSGPYFYVCDDSCPFQNDPVALAASIGLGIGWVHPLAQAMVHYDEMVREALRLEREAHDRAA